VAVVDSVADCVESAVGAAAGAAATVSSNPAEVAALTGDPPAAVEGAVPPAPSGPAGAFAPWLPFMDTDAPTDAAAEVPWGATDAAAVA
jgi:hypothetical protein